MEFTATKIIEQLRPASTCGVFSVRTLSEALHNSLTQRMARKYVELGELKPIVPNATHYSFSLERVADFLMRHPQYLIKPEPRRNDDLTPERIKSISDRTREYIRNALPSLADAAETDEVVQEVLVHFVRFRRAEGVPDIVIIINAVNKYLRKRAKRRNEVLLAPEAIERMCAGDEESDND